MLDRRDHERQRALADALRAQWRLFGRVMLQPARDGEGFHATIYLDATIVRGAAEQQGTNRSPALMSQADERRARAIAECVEKFNATLPPAERIRGYRVAP